MLRGSFQGLLKFLEEVERGNDVGQVKSASFYKKTDLKSKKEILYLKMIIQTITRDEDAD